MGVPYLIAIDGPAASGKSSVARALAQNLGFVYVNSGTLYRAVTWYILQRAIDVGDRTAVGRAIEQAQIDCVLSGSESRVSIGDVDPTEHLRDDKVNGAVSLISSVPRVREILSDKISTLRRRDAFFW